MSRCPGVGGWLESKMSATRQLIEVMTSLTRVPSHPLWRAIVCELFGHL